MTSLAITSVINDGNQGDSRTLAASTQGASTISPAAMKEGILYALTTPKNPPLDPATFNMWYNNKHLYDVCASTMCDLAIRYRNVDDDSQYQFLAIYRVPDSSLLEEETLNSIKAGVPKESQLLPGSHNAYDLLEVTSEALEQIQKFENPASTGKRSERIVTGHLEPQDCTEDEFKQFCRLQHHHMLHTNKVYERSTLYKRLGIDHPQYLVIHEYCSAELSTNVPEDKLNIIDDGGKDEEASGKVRIVETANWRYLSEHRTHDSFKF